MLRVGVGGIVMNVRKVGERNDSEAPAKYIKKIKIKFT